MTRKPKPEKAAAEVLAPILAEILDQFVRDGPLTAEEVETASRRFKKAHRAIGSDDSVRPNRSPEPVMNH